MVSGWWVVEDCVGETNVGSALPTLQCGVFSNSPKTKNQKPKTKNQQPTTQRENQLPALVLPSRSTRFTNNQKPTTNTQHPTTNH
ncbi:MAG: hypothetical protein ACHBN1_06220 [Heteroscytonema crispum UTEX LB 1556]